MPDNNDLPLALAVELFPECEQFESIGIIKPDSKIRELTMRWYGSRQAHCLLLTCGRIYQRLAQQYMDDMGYDS